MAAPVITRAISANTSPRLFGLLNWLIVPGICDAGRTVVGAVARLMLASVVCGRTRVSISVAAEAEPSFAVPASLLSVDESLIKAVPSARQNTSASSVSTRLHWGQRFIGW